MASTDKFTPGRSLKTYGRASRSLTYTPLQRSSPSTQTRDQENKPPAAEKNGSHRRNGLDRPKNTTTPSKSRPDTPATKETDKTVFDLPSSDDERQTNRERFQKRRKLSGPAPTPPSRSKEHDDTRHRQNLTPPSKQAHQDEKRKSAKVSPKTSKKPPEVEVVIRTPSKAKETWESVPAIRSTSPQKPILSPPNGSHSNTVGDTRDDEAEDNGQMDNSPSSSEPDSHATKRKLPIQTSGGSSSAKKQRTKPVHLSASKPVRNIDQSPSKISRSVGKHAATVLGTKTPGTPSRMKLVDALGVKKDDSSSDSGSIDDEDEQSVPHSPSERSAPPDAYASSRNSPQKAPASSQPSEPDTSHETLTNSRRGPITGQRVTYARQRSFRTEADILQGSGDVDPLKELASFEPKYPVAPNAAKPSASAPSTSFEFDDDGDAAGGAPRGVRSIYELRRAGNNARHQGVIEAIFDDLEDGSSSLSCKRNGLSQLCAKLVDYQFAHRFVSGSLDKRLAKCTEDLTDVISGFLLASIYGLLLMTTPASPIVLRTCATQITRVAPLLLDDERDILEVSKRRESKMTKSGQNTLRDVVGKLQSGKIWADQRPEILSCRVLALRCIELAIRRVRETGEPIEVIPESLLEQLVDILLQQSLESPHAETESNDLLVLELAFSILESYTVGLGEAEPAHEAILSRLSRLGPLLAELTQQAGSRSRQVQGLEIRLILNITNNNSRLCKSFSTPELVEALAEIVLSNFGSIAEELASNDKKESLLDTVILALGALINLMEWSGVARSLMLRPRTARPNSTILDGLIEVFSEGWENIAEAHSVVQTHANVAFGYLSVLLSTVAIEDEIRLHVRTALRGQRLDPLLSTVEEFLHHYRKVEEVQREEDAVAGFTSRLQGIVDRLRLAESGRKK